MFSFSLCFSLLAIAAGHVHAHVSIFHPSMYGFNVTGQTFPYDNRPVAPLVDLTFDKWWFHGHLGHPPNPGDVFELPAGKPATTELACNKGATSYFQSSEGGDIRQGDNPCPNSPLAAIHTTGFDDLTGCALAIAYKSDVSTIQPEDFTVFSVNQTCVWTRFTDFQVPANMPPCPPEGCHCAWFWIHSSNSGSQQNYMTGFKCNVTGSTSNVPVAKAKVPRRCGADPANRVAHPTPGNCTYGAKAPFYWFQKERNNMNEGTFSPPAYNDLYNFRDGPQDDIFEGSYDSIPQPSPNQTTIPNLRVAPGNTGVPVLPTSSSLIPSSSIVPPTVSPSEVPSSTVSPTISPSDIPSSALPCTSPASIPPSSTPGLVSPTPSPSNSSSSVPPPVTVTNTVFITVLPTFTGIPNSPSPTPSPIPPPPGVISLNKRNPMPMKMKKMLSTASNLRKRHWGSRRL